MSFILADTIITKSMEAMVEHIRQNMQNAGYNRITLKNWSNESQNESFPELLAHKLVLEEFQLIGISDFVVNNLAYNTMASKVTFDVSIPEIILSVGKGDVTINFFGSETTIKTKGKIVIVSPRVHGEAIISMSDGQGYELNGLDVQFKLGHIESNITVNVNEVDNSEMVNSFIKKIPVFIKKHDAKINEAIVNSVLKNIKQGDLNTFSKLNID